MAPAGSVAECYTGIIHGARGIPSSRTFTTCLDREGVGGAYLGTAASPAPRPFPGTPLRPMAASLPSQCCARDVSLYTCGNAA
jgi:hypothetical protein